MYLLQQETEKNLSPQGTYTLGVRDRNKIAVYSTCYDNCDKCRLKQSRDGEEEIDRLGLIAI